MIDMKPYILLNSAMTVDGKIATECGQLKISGKEDWMRVHRLRYEFDAIMVGINTILIDNPRLTIHKIDADFKDNPIRIVIDSKARTPSDARVLNDDSDTIIIVSDMASDEDIQRLTSKAEVIVCGKNRVDLKKAMSILYDRGIESILQEGGSTLNFAMLEEQLIDKISICIGSKILGGSRSKTLVDGHGFAEDDCVRLELENFYQLDKDIILEYDVKYN
jgi:2,5-diamino-6-(ribosylamino)-4(3H)-pyrimidinone 5'-phosphate reductase